MKKTILYKTLFFCWTILALTGCDLDLQKNYDYEPSVDDPYVKVIMPVCSFIGRMNLQA